MLISSSEAKAASSTTMRRGAEKPTLTHWRNEHGGGRADPFLSKKLFYVPADPWVEELHHFAKVIRGAAKSMINADDGMRTLAATLAVARSAKTGRPVTIKEMYS